MFGPGQYLDGGTNWKSWFAAGGGAGVSILWSVWILMPRYSALKVVLDWLGGGVTAISLMQNITIEKYTMEVITVVLKANNIFALFYFCVPGFLLLLLFVFSSNGLFLFM